MRGRTNNPYGRPKGVPNKKNAELREKITALIDDNWGNVQSDLDSLDPKDRLNLLEKLISYTLPKLQSVQMENEEVREHEKTVIVFNIPDNGRSSQKDVKEMTEDELRKVIADNEKELGQGTNSD